MEWQPVREAFEEILRSRLVALVVYGSAVTGDAIPGFSDLDLCVVLSEPVSLDDAISLQRRMPEPDGVAYIQPAYHEVGHPETHLVPGAFRELYGTLPKAFILDEAGLVQSSEQVLRDLPGLVRDDLLAWTGAIGEKRARHVRLMTTRLKPAVRALLVRLGEPPLPTWRAAWDGLVATWHRHDEERAAMLGDLLAELRSSMRDDRSCGELLLRLLASVCPAADEVPPASDDLELPTPKRPHDAWKPRP